MVPAESAVPSGKASQGPRRGTLCFWIKSPNIRAEFKEECPSAKVQHRLKTEITMSWSRNCYAPPTPAYSQQNFRAFKYKLSKCQSLRGCALDEGPLGVCVGGSCGP